MDNPFAELGDQKFGALLADPPWYWQSWGKFRRQRNGQAPLGSRDAQKHYDTMDIDAITALPVPSIVAKNAVLFLWATWPMLPEALAVISAWGFEYKTCAFCWTKADGRQVEMFNAEVKADMKLGYWTRANSEFNLLATCGKPKRTHADVRQAIIAPPRQHSRKPDGIHERIERLVAGPYLELFSRQQRSGWTSWGNETDKFKPSSEPTWAA